MIVECDNCEAFVDAEEIESYKYTRIDDKPSGRYLLLKCPICEKPILIAQDNIGNMVQGDIWDTPYVLYPRKLGHINPDIPSQIRSMHEEAIGCFKARSYTACSIMCRKSLEGMCVHQGVTKRNLAESLEALKEQNLIDNRLYEWADQLRLAGNQAAHDVDTSVSREDASDILELTTALLDYVFSFREKFERFKERRSSGT